jgi:hypothetical protein
MFKDVSSSIKLTSGLTPRVATDNTALVSDVLDCAGFTGALAMISYGTIADVDATFTTLLEESDASGSGFAAVADADLIGTEAGANPLFSDDGKTFKLAYKGQKRYLRLTITPAANSGNVPVCMIWALTNARSLPQTTQKV